MTDDTTGVMSPLDDDSQALLHAQVQRARKIDETCAEDAVHGYMREISAAEAQLDSVDVGDGPGFTAFSPSWHEESGP